jgi:hypothetical protein
MVAVMPGKAGDFMLVWKRGETETAVRLSLKALKVTQAVLAREFPESA